MAAPLQVDEAPARSAANDTVCDVVKTTRFGHRSGEPERADRPDAMAAALSWAEMRATWETEPRIPIGRKTWSHT